MEDVPEKWFDREIAACEFADARLAKRLRTLLERLGGAMGESIPLACQDWANTKAAYRFFSNDRVSEAAILEGHLRSTRDRFEASKGPILVLQDTTEFSFQREKPERIGFTTTSTAARIRPDAPECISSAGCSCTRALPSRPTVFPSAWRR